MKKNQFILVASTFISGIILGVSVLALFSFTGSGTVPVSVPGINKITTQEANVLFKNYYNKATPTTSVFKGFALNKEQLAALNYLSNENPGITGFRIYMGNDNTTGGVRIIVGVNGLGKDVTSSICQTDAVSSGPCPTICDGASAITSN